MEDLTIHEAIKRALKPLLKDVLDEDFTSTHGTDIIAELVTKKALEAAEIYPTCPAIRYADTHWSLEDAKGWADDNNVEIPDEKLHEFLEEHQQAILDYIVQKGNESFEDFFTDYFKEEVL
jgi:hypothetical protein